MAVTADQMRALMELGIDQNTMLAIVTIFERDASRDGRDARELAAARSRRYRARNRGISTTSESVSQETSAEASRSASRSASRDGRDGDLNTYLPYQSLLLKEGTSNKEVSTAVVVEGQKRKKRQLAALPENWSPSAMHFAAAQKLKISKELLESKAEDMRVWAQANDVRKANWDATFHGFLRRAATEGGNVGHRGSRSLQDDSKSVSRAAERLAEAAERGEFKIGPIPSLLPQPSEDSVLLLPKGRGS